MIRLRRFLLAVMLGGAIATTAPLLPVGPNLTHLTTPAAQAQRVRADNIWQSVYTKLPNLPKENGYTSKVTGKVEAENTLVGRLIRYHLYVKARSPYFRFDWKLTLADYLGANEPMGLVDEYPSAKTLKQNPLDGDTKQIRQLTLAQRNALVDALVSSFLPQRKAEPASPPAAQPAAQPSPQPSPSLAPVKPRVGTGADKLK
jgi:hypothetical protein